MTKQFSVSALLTACVLTLTIADAQADVIRGGTVIRNDLGANNPFGGGPARLFSQDGLVDSFAVPVSYVSGVTDFDAFDPANVLNLSTNAWFSATGATTGFTDFDLGVSATVTRLAFWDAPFGAIGSPNTNSTGDFNVFVSDDSMFSGATSVGSFTLLNNGLSTGALGQVFDFTDTVGQYVRIEHLTTQGGTRFGGGELAFATVTPSSVPEPGTTALFGLAGVVLSLCRKKRSTCQL